MKRTWILWAAALVLLAAVLIWFNGPWNEKPAVSGSEPGQTPPDFTLTCTDGSTFRLSEHRGQVVVLNIWATWCGPCVQELPNFDRLQQTYGAEVCVLAIHSELVTEDVDAYLSRYSHQIRFAVDKDGEATEALGGTEMLPQTVILDPEGIVVCNQVGSMTYERLCELVDQACGH